MSANLLLIFTLAKRSLFRNSRRTLLTVFLISCSLAAILFTDAFVKGMVSTMIKGSTETFIGDAQIHQQGFREANDVDLYIKNTAQLEQTLQKLPNIKAYAPRVLMGAMVSSSENVSSALVYGIDDIKEAQLSKLKRAMKSGNYLSGNAQEIILGTQLVDLLDVELGDRIVITVSQAHGGELSQSLFRLSGIFSFNERTMDSHFAFVNLEQGQTLLNIDGVHEVALRLSQKAITQNENTEDKYQQLWQTLNTDGLETLSWRELVPQLESMIAMSQYSTLIVSIIMYILVALGLINTMFMSIYERHTEFGILLAIGTRPKQLFTQIMLEGALIGVISALLGLLLGCLFAYWGSVVGIDYSEIDMGGISLNDPIYLIISLPTFAFMVGATILITMMSCIYPAIHAANLSPSFAMRKAL